MSERLQLLRKRGRGWSACVIAALTILLGGCVAETFSAPGASALGSTYFGYLAKEKGEPVVVTPDLEDYSDGLQALAADELRRLEPPCDRDGVAKDCSVVHRMIIDYGDLRLRIRAAKDD